MESLKDNQGNIIALINMNEVAMITRIIDKDQELTAIVLKSGNGIQYLMPIAEVAQQLYFKV